MDVGSLSALTNDLGLAAGRAVADGDGLDLKFTNHSQQRLRCFARFARRGGGRVNDVVVEQLALPVEADDLAAGAEARVDGQDVLAAERRGEQQLAQVVGEDADGFGVGAFLGFDPHFHFNRRPEQTLVAVLHRKSNLLRGGPLAGDEQRFEQP